MNVCNNPWMFAVVEMSLSDSIERYGCLIEYYQGEVLRSGRVCSCRNGRGGHQPNKSIICHLPHAWVFLRANLRVLVALPGRDHVYCYLHYLVSWNLSPELLGTSRG